MYNGIGLSTVRGSGTNGYVQKNMSHVNRKSQVEYRREMALVEKNGPPKAKKPDAGILEHNRKRKIELKIVEFQDVTSCNSAAHQFCKIPIASVHTHIAPRWPLLYSPSQSLLPRMMTFTPRLHIAPPMPSVSASALAHGALVRCVRLCVLQEGGMAATVRAPSVYACRRRRRRSGSGSRKMLR